MKLVYYYDFRLKNFSLDIKDECCGKIVKAVLHIEDCSSGVRHKLTLKNPKVHSATSSTIRDLFNGLTTESIDSFKVFGEQHEPGLRDSDVLWRIELWKDAHIKDANSTVHCNAIEGSPQGGWKTGLPSIKNCQQSLKKG